MQCIRKTCSVEYGIHDVHIIWEATKIKNDFFKMEAANSRQNEERDSFRNLIFTMHISIFTRLENTNNKWMENNIFMNMTILLLIMCGWTCVWRVRAADTSADLFAHCSLPIAECTTHWRSLFHCSFAFIFRMSRAFASSCSWMCIVLCIFLCVSLYG